MIAATLMDWFIRFPALWGACGVALGALVASIVAVLVFRRYGDSLVNINEKIVKQQDKQLAMMERTLLMQKEHYDKESAEVKERYDSALNEAKDEWQKCRKILHDEREKWHDESTRMQLLIQELEGRPDMRVLNTSLQDVVALIQKVADSLDKHDKSIDGRMQKFLRQFTAVMKKTRI